MISILICDWYRCWYRIDVNEWSCELFWLVGVGFDKNGWMDGSHVRWMCDWYQCECKCMSALHWRNNERDGVSNHQPHDCLLNCLFRRGSKKTSKLRVIGLCEGNSPMTGESPAQKASNAENASIWWHHHAQHIPWLSPTSLHHQLIIYLSCCWPAPCINSS